MLADEVALGKTIEASLVLCQLWAERRRRLLVICPAALRKQWALELNDQFFQQERDKLEAWAEDRIASAEQALKDTKLKGLKRLARMALSMEDAQRLQQDIRKTETEQRRQRQEIFAVEDEIEARRDALIAALQKRLHRASRNQSLFVVRWSVV